MRVLYDYRMATLKHMKDALNNHVYNLDSMDLKLDLTQTKGEHEFKLEIVENLNEIMP